MTGIIHIVDYGLGNLFSVARAIEACGGTARLATTAREIAAADRLVLPGVGAFANGMAGLKGDGLAEAVVAHANSERPLLGICLGMQMLATRGREFGDYEGLDLIPGTVVHIPHEEADGRRRKVPYVGWSPLSPARASGFAQTVLAPLDDGEQVYLVHSYHFRPDSPADLLATYDYEGLAITAAVARDNVVGCQFHPEKSALAGLKIFAAFMAL